MVFEFTVVTPPATYIPIIGELLLVPLDVTPVKLIEAIVLLLMSDVVPPVIPRNEIPLKVAATAPVSA
jgi:hypothetical protein